MSNVKILHNGGGWITNIGNAFVDYGSMASFREAISDVDVYLTSVLNRWVSFHVSRGTIGGFLRKPADISNVFDIQGAAKVDYISQSGAFLASHWFELHGETLLKAKEKGIKIIFNGAGMTDTTYSDDEIEKTRKWIKKINPDIFISRDETSYDNYNDLVEHSYNGIDVAFFLNNAYSPMKMDPSPDYILTFDKGDMNDLQVLGINEKDRIIRTHHSFWLNFNPKDIYKMKKEYYEQENTMISEIPEDYLNLYANTQVTYSDRVHACIATLSYGNPAKLFSSSPRTLLFERVGAKSITQKLTYPDVDKINAEKSKQTKFLSEVL